MYVGSLFSGIGGIELGFQRAGFKTKWFIECDKYAKEIIRKNFRDAIIYDDITKVNFRSIPKVDILTGGFPCQDISSSGKRAGITGSKSSLWKYYSKAIRILRPRFAFIENVSILINRGLDVVLADLASIGYDAEWYCVPASAIGAPHQRDRVYVIAYLPSERERFLSIFKRDKRSKDFNINRDIKDASNTDNQRQSRKGENEIRQELFRKGTGQWTVEPKLDRVVHGIPCRMDRIKCLGNAVVPQIAEVFGEAIMSGYKERGQ